MFAAPRHFASAGHKPKRQKFNRYPISFFHIDTAELQTAEGSSSLFVAIDRTTKLAVDQLADKTDEDSLEFLEQLLKIMPYYSYDLDQESTLKAPLLQANGGRDPIR